MVEALQVVANGLAVGSILLLGAVGLSLLYGVKRFANIAHGEFMTLGAYLALLGWVEWGLGFWPGVLIALAGVAALGVALEAGVFARLRARPAAVALLASVGVSFALQNLVRMVWTPRAQAYPLPAETVVPLGLGAALTPTKLALIALAVGAALGLHLLLTRTTLGKALRATADNRDLARVAGIPAGRLEVLAWALAGALAAMAGIALGAITLLTPDMGFTQLLLIFAAVLLGGIGSPYGAMLGAMVIGVVMEGSKPLLVGAGMEPTLGPAAAFAILVAMLLLRPEGLLGEAPSRAWPWRRRRRPAAAEEASRG